MRGYDVTENFLLLATKSHEKNGTKAFISKVNGNASKKPKESKKEYDFRKP